MWWLHWFSHFAMAHLPGGRRALRWSQDWLGEHRSLESSTRFDHAVYLLQHAKRLTQGSSDPLVIEIGTGWIPAIALTLMLVGLRTHTYDVVRHIDTSLFRRTRAVLRQRGDQIAATAGIPVAEIEERLQAISHVDQLSAAADVLGGRYSAPIDTTTLPHRNGEADLVVSNLVLQCIPREVLKPVVQETFRVLKPGGHAIHRMYLGDEYAGRDPRRNHLHYLTYSDETWRRWFCHRLKHLNRLRAPQFLSLFEEIGFEVDNAERSVDEESIEHLKRIKLAREFRGMSWEDLATTSLAVILRKPTTGPNGNV